MAKSKVLIENYKTLVTEWLFNIDDIADYHLYECNYSYSFTEIEVIK